MKTKICNTLNTLGVPFGARGRDYIESAVEFVLSKGRMGITKELYPLIAKAYDTKPANVERAIRHTIDMTFSNAVPKQIEDFFGNTVSIKTGKLSNSEFIYGIVKYIQIYG